MENPYALYLDIEVLKLWKLRKILSKAWIPMGISKDEACDILIWAVGSDVKNLHFSHWPQRIMDNTGIRFDPKKHTMLSVFRMVARKWREEKPMVFYPKN